MCGILFSYRNSLAAPGHQARCESALQKQFHRGPDEGNLINTHPVIIGHRRLSIIDISGSHQPLADAGGRYVLSYNGEIYNYRELKQSLASKWSFATEGDTEVLLAGLVTEGTGFVSKLEGMWAFALWDNVEQSLLLCRDRLGKKPLYYFSAQGSRDFGCASELPAILRLQDNRPTEDENSLADYFRYGYFLPGTSVYEGVKEVPPGQCLQWAPGQPPVLSPFWRLRPQPFQGSKRDARRLLLETFEDAVSKRLVADVEAGAFLSGGVDSSLVVAVAGKASGRPLKTFTIGFNEASFDESAYARETAAYFKTDHYEDTLDRLEPNELCKLILDHVGQPFADASLLPTVKVSQLAANNVKVALSGDGGDELFSGYQRYQARAILRWYTRLPRFFKNNVERAIKLLPDNAQHHSRSIIKKAHLFVDTVERSDSQSPYIAPLVYSNAFLKRLVPDIFDKGHSRDFGTPEYMGDDIKNMMYADAHMYLPQDILLKVDRASMAYSLEARAPFLDHRLVELAFSLPLSWHRTMFSGKAMLKSSFRELLPDSVWNRRKQGFGVPLGDWFKGVLGSELKQLNNTLVTPLNRKLVNEMLELHSYGARDFGLRLWQLYCYLKWKSET